MDEKRVFPPEGLGGTAGNSDRFSSTFCTSRTALMEARLHGHRLSRHLAASPIMTLTAIPEVTEEVGDLDDTTTSSLVTSDDDSDPFPDPTTDYTATWTTVSDALASQSSYWSDDEDEDSYPLEEEERAEEPQLCEQFRFPGAQYETFRTILRQNPRYAALGMYELTPQLDSTIPQDDNSIVKAPDVSPLSEVSDSRPSTPELSACEATSRAVQWALERLHFEEDVEFREHEWFLEQAGCGRVEIWVTEEQGLWPDPQDDNRPRVFFPPPGPRL